MNLLERDYWIFDMDGTLTVDVHDFDAIRISLGLPVDRPILETIATLPEDQAEVLYRRLEEIEWQLASEAIPQKGAGELLEGLRQRGARMGILTRNSQRNACETLRTCGFLDFFELACVLGRESVPPKPDPDGIHHLLEYWGALPAAAVMVGDYLFDIEAGRRAGTATVYIDVAGADQWTDQADLRITDLGELLSLAVS